jgi:hypothetical protein
MPQRAKKKDPNSRCCWVCGKHGGDGFSIMLRMLGYPVGKNVVAHAHPRCIDKAKAKARAAAQHANAFTRL